MRRSWWLGPMVVVASSACGDLREEAIGPAASADDGGVPSWPADGRTDGGASPRGDGGGGEGLPLPRAFDEAQKLLASKRYPGPTSIPSAIARYRCTDRSLVWRDPDGAMHAFTGGTRLDYAFKAKGFLSYVSASDAMVVHDTTGPVGEPRLDAYATNAASSLLGTIPYAPHHAATPDGILLLEQYADGAPLGGTRVRLWKPGGGAPEPVTTATLPTNQPPVAASGGKVVIPGGASPPFPLYVVDGIAKTTSSVTFDGGSMVVNAIAPPEGLVISYTRNSSIAIRLYKGGQDAPTTRFELGDEVNNRAPLFADAPASEHTVLPQIAYWKGHVLFSGYHGIFAYTLATGKLWPVQLGVGGKMMSLDMLCVMPAEDLLAYRASDDLNGQIWLVPLASVAPATPP